jgi:gamma-glutamyltranspeptidase / glutathione hydrolase
MTATSGVVRLALAGDPPVQAQRGVVSGQHPTAASVGVAIMANGGNIMDAAVATAFAHTVADVGRTGIGGYGGHLVYYEASSGQTWLVDFPSCAPRAAHRDVLPPLTGALAVGVPGVVAGLAAAHERFGGLPWRDVLAPAIALAEDGIEFGPSGRDPVLAERERAAAFAETVRVFIDAWDGYSLRQPDLASSLRRLAERGAKDLYTGELADAIVTYVRSAGGVLDRADLGNYAPAIELAPRVRYRGHDICTPGVGSGAGVLLPWLRELDALDLPSMEPLGAQLMGLLAATAGGIWRDRLARAGFVDGDWVGPPLPTDQGCTSHFSMADTQGNVVACTTTLQVLLGSAATVPGTGIVLNSAMALFDPRPGLPNSVGPGKRVVTNMCPTIVLRDSRPRLATGASGGRRIPSMLLQLLTLVLDHGFSVPRALRAPRFHHEGDSVLHLEEGLTDATLTELAAQGYRIELNPANGTALGGQTPAIWFDDAGQLYGAPDPRRHGGAAAL